MNPRTIVCEDLNLAIDEWRAKGFRIDLIAPADEPQTVWMSHGDAALRLRTPGAAEPNDALPPFQPAFVISRATGDGGLGRAGMTYRDLIPGRLGGRYIASHITIKAGGPVDDWVHYHQLALQLIVVRRGWVRVVYEDQGEPFVMQAGDLVLQPPGVRHRVLESSPGLEVVEISAPALHPTLADHDLVLPNRLDPDRSFRGQRFLWHRGSEAAWHPSGHAMIQDTELSVASAGLGDAKFVRANAGPVEFAAHDGELVFGFVLEGSGRLDANESADLGPADAFVIPPGAPWRLTEPSANFHLLLVTTGKLATARLDGAGR